MKPHRAAALETRLLVQLVAKVKSLNLLFSQGHGVMNLKCPCGKVILAATPVISNLKDRQRGLLKSRVDGHLRAEHGLSKQTIRVVLNEAFTPD